MSDPAPLPDLFTADVPSAQVLEHVRSLRSTASELDIKLATSGDPRPRAADLAALELALENGSLVRAMLRMRLGANIVIDSLLRTTSGFRVVRFQPSDGTPPGREEHGGGAAPSP